MDGRNESFSEILHWHGSRLLPLMHPHRAFRWEQGPSVRPEIAPSSMSIAHHGVDRLDAFAEMLSDRQEPVLNVAMS
jgi:hypothetical protein